MWIDTRGGCIKVYERQSSDPYIQRMTWVPEENAWVLFKPSKIPDKVHELAASLGDPVQIQALKDFDAGKLTYYQMRELCG
jgi:hypothetical protein